VSVYGVAEPQEWLPAVFGMGVGRGFLYWDLAALVPGQRDTWCWCWPARLVDHRPTSGQMLLWWLDPARDLNARDPERTPELSAVHQGATPAALAQALALDTELPRPHKGLADHPGHVSSVLRTVFAILDDLAQQDGDSIDSREVRAMLLMLALAAD
jgi:hypothetical protein